MGVERVLARIQEVCPLPTAAQRVMELTARDDVRIKDIVEAIALDAALAGEVLRIANSAAYGSRRVDTLERAAVTLGLTELNTMATAMAMLAAFGSKHERCAGLHERSVLAGAVARQLGADLGVAAPVAFLAGLLSEIGAMACLALDGDAYAVMLRASERGFLETQRYGATSHQIGGALLRRNLLPDTVCDAVAGEGDATLTSLIRFVRGAVPSLIAAGKAGVLDGLEDGLVDAAERASVPIPAPRLLQLCLQGAGVAGAAMVSSA